MGAAHPRREGAKRAGHNSCHHHTTDDTCCANTASGPSPCGAGAAPVASKPTEVYAGYHMTLYQNLKGEVTADASTIGEGCSIDCKQDKGARPAVGGDSACKKDTTPAYKALAAAYASSKLSTITGGWNLRDFDIDYYTTQVVAGTNHKICVQRYDACAKPKREGSPCTACNPASAAVSGCMETMVLKSCQKGQCVTGVPLSRKLLAAIVRDEKKLVLEGAKADYGTKCTVNATAAGCTALKLQVDTAETELNDAEAEVQAASTAETNPNSTTTATPGTNPGIDTKAIMVATEKALNDCIGTQNTVAGKAHVIVMRPPPPPLPPSLCFHNGAKHRNFEMWSASQCRQVLGCKTCLESRIPNI